MPSRNADRNFPYLGYDWKKDANSEAPFFCRDASQIAIGTTPRRSKVPVSTLGGLPPRPWDEPRLHTG